MSEKECITMKKENIQLWKNNKDLFVKVVVNNEFGGESIEKREIKELISILKLIEENKKFFLTTNFEK